MNRKEILKKYRIPITEAMPDRLVVVLGQPSAGTRLVTRIVLAGEMPAYHDNQHGHRLWKSGKVLLVKRNDKDREKSVKARWPDTGGPSTPSFEELRENYPDAPIVHYEDVVSDVDGVISELADWLNMEPWEHNEEEIYDANAEEGTREEIIRRNRS
jgi:hypothetical protein